MIKPSDAEKKSEKKSPKLSVKKEPLKDLKVTSGKAKEIKGGGARLSQPKTPCDPGCTPC